MIDKWHQGRAIARVARFAAIVAIVIVAGAVLIGGIGFAQYLDSSGHHFLSVLAALGVFGIILAVVITWADW